MAPKNTTSMQPHQQGMQPQIYRPESMIARYAFCIVTLIILLIVGYGAYLVRAYLIYVGYFAVVSAALFLLLGVVAGVVYLVRFIAKVDFYEIGQNGSALRNALGQVTILSPLTSNQAQISKRGKKVTVTPVVPSIIEEIANGVIALGQLVMHMGYEESKGGLLPVIDRWPGTFGIAGRGRSGKTRRVLCIVIQALMGRARIFICDPHATKDDSLARLLAPLAPWLTIACNEAEIIALSKYFLAEMENRVQGFSEDRTPWLIIYDEWSRLMTTSLIDETDRDVLKHNVEHCSTEYAGYFGFAGIIGQTWTEEAAGGTVIRRSLHKAFVHQLSSEYAKFFVKGRWANKAEDLTTRQCLYRVDGQVKLIVTHTVPDDTAAWFADWLTQNMPPETIEAPVTQKQLERPSSEVQQDESFHTAVTQKVTRRATISDALSVWEELGEMGRPRLRDELTARGLECTDDLAKQLLKNVKSRLEKDGGDHVCL